MLDGVDGRSLSLPFFLFGVRVLLWHQIELLRVLDNAYVLLKLCNLRLVYLNLVSLVAGCSEYILQLLVQQLIFVPLSSHVLLQLLVVFPSVSVQLVAHDFGFLDQKVHHDVNLLPDGVSFLFEHLQEVVSLDELVLQEEG